MPFKPFSETSLIIRGNSNKNGINTGAVNHLLQGNEIRDPLKLRRGIVPFMGMRQISVDEKGLLDHSIEINDLGQDIKASTTAFVDTTERLTPTQILMSDTDLFLNELVTQQTIDEKSDGLISIFEPNGIEIPFSLRGAKGSVFSEDEYRGWQPIDSSYQFVPGLDEFLDGQEEILEIAVPSIQSTNDVCNLPYNDARQDDTDRFGINILNQNVDLYNRYASNGFTYGNNVRDSLAYGGLKD
jgi:hypothetical protein